MFTEAQVYGWLAPLLWGHGQGHSVVESAGRPFSSCLEPERKERRKELEFPVSPIKTCLQQLEDTEVLPLKGPLPMVPF